MFAQDAAEIERGIAGRQARRGDLVQKWLELLIIIPIQQGDTNTRVFRKVHCAVQAAKACAYDHHVLRRAVGIAIFHLFPSF